MFMREIKTISRELPGGRFLRTAKLASTCRIFETLLTVVMGYCTPVGAVRCCGVALFSGSQPLRATHLNDRQ